MIVSINMTHIHWLPSVPLLALPTIVWTIGIFDTTPPYWGVISLVFIINTHMFIPSESTIILSVIGCIGIIATSVVFAYGFNRQLT